MPGAGARRHGGGEGGGNRDLGDSCAPPPRSWDRGFTMNLGSSDDESEVLLRVQERLREASSFPALAVG
jgi:hypothetical protein